MKRRSVGESVVAILGVHLRWLGSIVEIPVRLTLRLGNSLRENLQLILLVGLFHLKDRYLGLSLVLGVRFGSLIDQTFGIAISLRIVLSAKKCSRF